MDSIFHESREKIEKALEQVENIESITEDPTCYINQHFDLNINHISWRRIDLKAEIDQYCDQLLEENESNRTKCLQLSNETDQITKKINETKEELHLLKKRFDAFDSNTTKMSCELSTMNANYLMEKFCFMHEEHNKSLLQHKDFIFIFYDRPIEDIVGKLVDKKQTVEENLPSLSYKEPIPQLSEIRSIEALDIRESFSEGMQMVNEKSNLEIQIGHNVEKTEPIDVEQIEENLPSISNEEQMPEPSEQQIGQNIKKLKKKGCMNRKKNCKSIAIDGYSYNLKSQLQNGNTFYLCKKRHTERCQGKVILSPNGLIVEKLNHSCGGIGTIDKPLEDNEFEKVQEYEKISDGDKCPGFIKMTPNNRIVKDVDHTFSGNYTVDKPSEDNGLEEIKEYEVIGKKFKINGHRYYFRVEFKSKNKYFQCILSNSTKNRCLGSITITPDLQIAKKVEHNCIDLLEMEKVLEYEEIGRQFKINGHRYYFRVEFKSMNKYFQCLHYNSTKKRCHGTITITPNNQIVKKVDHTCSGKYTVDKPSENNGLEEVQEYEGNGNNFKINGHTYHFTTEPKTGNKYFRCIYTNTKKCPGSFVITPNCGIAKKVEHTCIGIDAEEKPLEDNELEEVHEYEEIRNKFKINGHLYYFPSELSDNKYFQCIYANLTRKKCQGSILLTPNNRIAKKVDHSCHQVCKITPQKTSKTAEEKACPSLSVGLLNEKCPGLVTNHQIARNVELSCIKASQECSTIVGKEVYRRCSVVLEDLKNGTDQRFY